MNDQQLETLSREGQLYLNLTEMRTIKDYYVSQEKDPTDVELESIAQTWSEHCSHTKHWPVEFIFEMKNVIFILRTCSKKRFLPPLRKFVNHLGRKTGVSASSPTMPA